MSRKRGPLGPEFSRRVKTPSPVPRRHAHCQAPGARGVSFLVLLALTLFDPLGPTATPTTRLMPAVHLGPWAAQVANGLECKVANLLCLFPWPPPPPTQTPPRSSTYPAAVGLAGRRRTSAGPRQGLRRRDPRRGRAGKVKPCGRVLIWPACHGLANTHTHTHTNTHPTFPTVSGTCCPVGSPLSALFCPR